ncbi:MAG TPA: SDR family oxidoreductase [Pseudonocardiaceae bacterium]|nr:SDR family oxidoreductase [Pseudonocardiaceae bacterium]
MDAIFRGEHHVGSPSIARLPARHGAAQPGTSSVHLLGISPEHSGRDDPLRLTKTAALAISRGLAKRVAGTGVAVNAILPGPTLSGGLEAMRQEAKEKSGLSIEEAAAAVFVREHRPSSIIQRAASVEEVANLVVYAASPQASATTGAALRVDGGVIETIV